MAWATYHEFRVAVQLMIDGDDVSPSVMSPGTLDLMISLGEALVYNGNEAGIDPLRASSMLVEFADVAANGNVVADNAVDIPTDCLEIQSLRFEDDKPLEIVSEAELRPWLESGGGDVRMAAQAGDTLIFAPPASDGDELLGRYYAKPGPLKDALHATFNRYPELFLYAALYSSAPFLGYDKRIPVWQNYYRSLLEQAHRSERMRAYSGSTLRMRAR